MREARDTEPWLRPPPGAVALPGRGGPSSVDAPSMSREQQRCSIGVVSGRVLARTWASPAGVAGRVRLAGQKGGQAGSPRPAGTMPGKPDQNVGGDQRFHRLSARRFARHGHARRTQRRGFEYPSADRCLALQLAAPFFVQRRQAVQLSPGRPDAAGHSDQLTSGAAQLGPSANRDGAGRSSSPGPKPAARPGRSAVPETFLSTLRKGVAGDGT